MSEVRQLLVKGDGPQERTVPVGRYPITIGRDETATIRVDSPFVSRLHARIEPRPDGPLFVDLGSHNGSLLNGQVTTAPTRLQAGDVIEIADVRIVCLAGHTSAVATRTFTRDQVPAATPRRSTQPQSAADAHPDAAAEAGATLVVDGPTHEVRLGGAAPARPLSAQEFSLLHYLYARQDRVCTRQELGDAIWGKDGWDMNMLHRLVHRLKEKIEPEPSQARYVKTVPGVGYRLTP
jgi:pSer/pThr/pTyr-binding forkhead associated (FHA) protein